MVGIILGANLASFSLDEIPYNQHKSRVYPITIDFEDDFAWGIARDR